MSSSKLCVHFNLHNHDTYDLSQAAHTDNCIAQQTTRRWQIRIAECNNYHIAGFGAEPKRSSARSTIAVFVPAVLNHEPGYFWRDGVLFDIVDIYIHITHLLLGIPPNDTSLAYFYRPTHKSSRTTSEVIVQHTMPYNGYLQYSKCLVQGSIEISCVRVRGNADIIPPSPSPLFHGDTPSTPASHR